MPSWVYGPHELKLLQNPGLQQTSFKWLLSTSPCQFHFTHLSTSVPWGPGPPGWILDGFSAGRVFYIPLPLF